MNGKNRKNIKIIVTIFAVLAIILFWLLSSCTSKCNNTVIVNNSEEIQETASQEVNEEKVNEDTIVEEIKQEQEDGNTLSYYINYLNKDGSVLQRTIYTYGSIPSYTGETPVYEDGSFYYSFVGWDKTASPVTMTQTYNAIYEVVGSVYCYNGASDSSTLSNVFNEDSILELTLYSPKITATIYLKYKYVGGIFEVQLIKENENDVTSNYASSCTVTKDGLDFIFNMGGVKATVNTSSKEVVRDMGLTAMHYYFTSIKINGSETIDQITEKPVIYTNLQNVHELTVPGNQRPTEASQLGTIEFYFEADSPYELMSDNPDVAGGAEFVSWDSNIGKLVINVTEENRGHSVYIFVRNASY